MLELLIIAGAFVFGRSRARRAGRDPMLTATAVVTLYLLAELAILLCVRAPMLGMAGAAAAAGALLVVGIRPRQRGRARGRQRSWIPWRLVAVLAACLGYGALFYGTAMIASSRSPSFHLIGFHAYALVGWGLSLLGCAVQCLQLGRRSRVPTVEQKRARDRRAPVLFLRSFALSRQAVAFDRGASPLDDTATFEQTLVDELEVIGPVVAVADPRSRFPALGAAKSYLADDRWQAYVARLARDASCVIIVEGATEGLAWELGLVRFAVDPRRVFVFTLPMVEQRSAIWPDFREKMEQLRYGMPHHNPGPNKVISFDAKHKAAHVGDLGTSSCAQIVAGRLRGLGDTLEPARPPWRLRWPRLSVLATLGALFVAGVMPLVALRLFVVDVVTVGKRSMEPSLRRADAVAVDKVGAPARGDIVHFRRDEPDALTELLRVSIKRTIPAGLAGRWAEWIRGPPRERGRHSMRDVSRVIAVEGDVVVLDGDTLRAKRPGASGSGPAWRVQQGEVFVADDTIVGGAGYFGAVARSDIDGRVILRCWSVEGGAIEWARSYTRIGR